MNITGHTRVFMIVGDPVAQVRAPEVYNQLFARHGIDAVLVPMKVAPAALAGFVRNAFAAQNLGGMWVTIPHKAAMQQIMDRCDPLATLAGAVNAVRRAADGAIEGALGDGVGLVEAPDHFGVAVAGRRAPVAGAGGQAVAAAIAQRAPAPPAIANRTPKRAAELVARLVPSFGAFVVAAPGTDPAGFDLVVNCTPQGPKPDDPLPFDVRRVDAGATVVDSMMEDGTLLRACAARGSAARAGQEMPVWQVPEQLRFMGSADPAPQLQADLSEVRALRGPRRPALCER